MFSRFHKTTNGISLLIGRCHPPLAANTATTPRYWNSHQLEGKLGSKQPSTETLPLIIFCHATGFCKDVWKPVTDELASFALAPFRWVALDFSGHGSSRPIRDGGVQNWAFAAEDVASIIEDYSEGAPVFGVGHSMGATALIMNSLNGNKSLKSLVLFEPIILPTLKDDPMTPTLSGSANRRRRAWPSVEDFREYIQSRKNFGRFDPRAAAAYAMGGSKPSVDGGVELACDPSVEASIYVGGPRELRGRLPEVPVACHVVSGQLSVEPMQSAFFRQLVESAGPSKAKVPGKGWTWQEVAGGGHFLIMEQPRACAAIIAAASIQAGLGLFRAHSGGCGT